MAISIHLPTLRLPLKDRLLENQLSLRALDKLAVAPSQSHKQAIRKHQQYKRPHRSRSGTVDMLDEVTAHTDEVDSSPIDPPSRQSRPTSPADEKGNTRARNTSRHRKRGQKISTRVLRQLGGAIAEVALKDSKLNRAGEIGMVHRAYITE